MGGVAALSSLQTLSRPAARRTPHTWPNTRASAGPPRAQPARGAEQQHGFDIALSSGFLAFAAHIGFLQAVEEVDLPVNGVMGTSAGALVGSLWCAGYSPREIAAEFVRTTPIERLELSSQPLGQGGLLSLAPVARALRNLIPPRFEELQRDFAVGVVDVDDLHRLLDSGSLPEAVAASAAIPLVFAKMHVPGAPGGPFADGGVHCRIGLDLWRRHRYGLAGSVGGSSSSRGVVSGSTKAVGAMAAPPAVVHLIHRSSPFSGNDSTAGLEPLRARAALPLRSAPGASLVDGRARASPPPPPPPPGPTAAANATVIHSPKSGRNFWDLGDFDKQFSAARDRALPVLEGLLLERQARGAAAAGVGRAAQHPPPAPRADEEQQRAGAVRSLPVAPAPGGRASLGVAAVALPPSASARGQ
eukprot:scaffold12.g8071.t1